MHGQEQNQPGSGQLGIRLSRARWVRNLHPRLLGLSSLCGEGEKGLFPLAGMGDSTAWHLPQPWVKKKPLEPALSSCVPLLPMP